MNEYLFHVFFIAYALLIYKYRNKISILFGIMDFPDNSRKSHLSPIPCIGGLIIFPYISASLIALYFISFIKIKILLIWLFIFTSFFITGFLDDRIHLNAKTKTFILLFVLFIVLPLDKSLIIEYLIFKDVKYPILLNQGSLFFTIFCIYFFYNSLNFSDGLNGISISLSLYFLITIIIERNEFNIFYFSLLLGLLVVLLPNLLSKIFIGNSGVSFLASVIFLLLIDSYKNGYLLFDEIILIVFLPTVDAVRITLERITKGYSPFTSDKNHFHHLLTKIFNKKYVFIPYLIFAILPYLCSKIGVISYLSFIIFTIIYFLVFLFLRTKNV